MNAPPGGGLTPTVQRLGPPPPTHVTLTLPGGEPAMYDITHQPRSREMAERECSKLRDPVFGDCHQEVSRKLEAGE